MSVLILDSNGSHAKVVEIISSLGTYDIVYCSDTLRVPHDQLSAFTRVSRLLGLLSLHSHHPLSAAVLLGPGMSNPTREAIELCTRTTGIELLCGPDLLVDEASSDSRPGGLCVIGDSCLTEADLRERLGRRELLRIPWCRIAPLFEHDEPLVALLAGWQRRMGKYVLATPDNVRIKSQILRHDPGADILDEHELLALAIAERLPESPVRRIDVSVTERTPKALAQICSSLGIKDTEVRRVGWPEPTPTMGPMAMALDVDGQPLRVRE